MADIEQPYRQPTISVTDAPQMGRQTMPIPYARDNLGEDNYGTNAGGPVDRQIDNQQAHGDWYYANQDDQSAFSKEYGHPGT